MERIMTTHPMQHKVVLVDEAATALLAGRVAHRAVAGDVLALSGDLGSGKTVFARAFINARSATARDVPSPTYTLVQEYEFPGDGENIPVYHFDLYRIESAEETMELGMDEAFAAGISLIEWPERMQGRLPDNRLEITLTEGGGAGVRNAGLLGLGSWQPRLEEILIEGNSGD